MSLAVWRWFSASGQVLLPDNVANLVQHHGQGIAVHPLGRDVGGVPCRPCRRWGAGLGQGTHFCTLSDAPLYPHAGVDRHA